MQFSTLIVLACLIAVVVARAQDQFPAVEAVQTLEDAYGGAHDTPAQEQTIRTKRGLLLLKKKLLLGALGLKAAKVGAVGAAGVAGALALKKKQSVPPKVTVHTPAHYGYSSHGPSWNVDVHSWH